ncbi:MAG: hypothetical protein ACUVRI_08170 [Armatimonadota bacterium]
MKCGKEIVQVEVFRVERFLQNPVIHPGLDETIGDNINGPSLIKVPWWVENALGKYYLYFAHHRGDYIRLAYADCLEGPWRVYRPGTLRIDQTPCQGHIASPDVYVDGDRREILMYYHGGFPSEQKTFLAVSKDGLTFRSMTEPLGPFYFRVFEHESYYYAIAKSTNSECGGSFFDRATVGVRSSWGSVLSPI